MKQIIFPTVLIAAGSVVHADSLTHYGAIAGSFSPDVPFAENTVLNEAYNADLGIGLSYGLIYRDDQGPLMGRPLEYGFEVGAILGDETTGDAVPTSCNVDTYIGLISDCQDVANYDSITYWIDASAMVNFGQAGGATDLLAGVGLLHFGNKSDSEFLYPTGFENFVDRDTSFTGAGIKLGARHRIEMQNGMTLNLAGFGGAYAGQRETSIFDLETDVGAFNDSQSFSTTENTTVYVVELRPSIDIPVTWAGPNGMLEVGISHKIFMDVLDTTGYDDHDGVDLGGGLNEDVSVTSIFAGITIPM